MDNENKLEDLKYRANLIVADPPIGDLCLLHKAELRDIIQQVSEFHKDLREKYAELKQTNEELSLIKQEFSETEKKYKLLFDHLTTGFALHKIIYNEHNIAIDYEFIAVNPAFEKLTGFRKDQLIGKSVLTVMPKTEHYWIENFASVALTGKSFEFENYSEELNKHFHVLAFCPQQRYFAVIFTDITEPKQREKELIEAKEKAEESNRLKSAFLQNMSHEVRTPMNAIIGFSQLLTKPNQTPEKILKFSEQINNGCQKLIEIMTDVIEISQIHAGLIKLKNSEFDVTNCITDVCNEFKNQALEKQIELILKINVIHTEHLVALDKEKLEKILRHLIGNALKFTQKGFVKVDCEFDLKQLVFKISDSGIGISKAMQEKIFEPFRQADTGISRNFGGTGLGLSIAKSFVEMLSGQLQLHSEINKGTHIEITIPAEQLNQNNNQQMDISRYQFNNQIILLVDDEQSNIEFLAEVLGDTKAQLLIAYNGQEAVDFCRNEKKIDLVLMDIKMPVMDGHLATRLIKAFRPELRIIAQTAFALDTDKEKIIESGFDHYLVKPIDMDLLLETVQKFLP